MNLLPNHKILDWSKLKAFANDVQYVTQKLSFFLRWVKAWEMEKMLVDKILSFFHDAFDRLLFLTLFFF